MTQDTSASAPVRIFLSGACSGLAEARDTLAAHPEIELVGMASDVSRAGAKYTTSGAQVVLHALGRPDASPRAELEAIRRHTQAPVVLLTTAVSPKQMREAIDSGVSDVSLLPQAADNLVFTVRKALSMGALLSARIGDVPTGRRAGTSCRVITVFSPKGGAGKTVLSTNLGTAFAHRLKRRSLLIDLDLQFGDVAIMLGLDPKQTLLDLVMTHGELDQDKVSGLVTQHETGLHVVPAPVRPEDAELVTEDRLGSLLSIAKQAYDVVLIDTPPSFNASVLTALDRTDVLLIVCSMDIPSVKGVKVALKTLEMLHFPSDRVRIVLNRSATKVGLKRSEIEHVIGRKVDFEIPSNRAVPVAVNRGIPVMVTDPKSDVARAIHRISLELLPDVANPRHSDQEADGGPPKLSRGDRRRVRRAQRESVHERWDDVDDDDRAPAAA